MSVWKSVKNNTMEKAVDMEMLERGLETMGVSLDYTVNSISNSWGHEECTAAFVRDGKVLSLGIKVDGTPGRLNQVSALIQREGVFYGMCSELCGIGHAQMPIKVEAVSLPKFLE